jgi:F-type H+-transporting ATPase subunit b
MRAFSIAAAALAALVPGLTLAAEGNQKAGLPQLDPASWTPQLFWLLVTFVLLYLLMAKVALPRVAQVLETREKRIAGDLAEAERLKVETEQAIASYEAALAKARAEAQATADATRQKVTQDAAAAKARVEAELATKSKAAETAILAARDRALASLDQMAAEAAASIVQRLTGTVVPAADAQAAIAAARKA